VLCASLAFSVAVHGQDTAKTIDAPLMLVDTYQMPAEVKGNFDHIEVDLKRKRLFATPEDFKAVLVFDIETGKLIHTIGGITRPHAVLYRADVDRLYVTDGGDGSVKVYDGESYGLLSRIQLLKDADSIGFDLSRKYLYVDNGGGDVGQKYSMLSVIDADAMTKNAEMKIDGDTLEAMTLDTYRPRIYVNDKATNEVVVIDRFTNSIVARWPITLGKTNVAMALDEQRQRLFIGCRNGKVVVFDTNTGKELQVLTIAQGIDDLIYDASTRRIYAAANGEVDVFDQKDLNTYAAAGSVANGVNGRTAKFVPQLNRLYVALPQSGGKNARILVYQPVGAPEPKLPVTGEMRPVPAPVAEGLVMGMLSAHPHLRKMGLHVIPPGKDTMILIANGNMTRLGVLTSESDFAAVKNGKMYGPLNADGQFYNMKMQMFDAQGRRIGILVMEIPATDAGSESEAAQQAARIRDELAKKIPSLEALFAQGK
jgi:DNA-binding beta-propeller fold protein YncE